MLQWDEIPQQEATPQHKNFRVRQKFGHIGNERGRINEALVLASIERLKLGWIASARLANHDEDQHKIDIVCESDIGKLYLQVKSSRSGCKRFRKEHRCKTMIECVVATSRTEILDRRVHAALHSLRGRILQRKNP